MADSTSRKSVIVRMPSPLKRRVAREVDRTRGYMNDDVLRILSERYGDHVSPSGRRGTAPGASGVVVLRMPDELKRALKAEAKQNGTTTNDVIVRALQSALGQERTP